MKTIFRFWTICQVAGLVLVSSCSKDQSPAQYEKNVVPAVLESVSADRLLWECDGLETHKITLEGQGLVPETVSAVTDAEPSAFNVDVNGDVILVSPKSVNTDSQNDVKEVLSISVDGGDIFCVELFQSRMNKPMLTSVTPEVLEWAYDNMDKKSVTVTGLNLEGVKLSASSDTDNSAFNLEVDGTTIEVSPKSQNDSPDVVRSEVITVSVDGGNSISFTVVQARKPSPAGVVYYTRFDNTDKPAADLSKYVFDDEPRTYTSDGKKWTMTYADVTSQYVWVGKTSHVLARVYRETDQQSVIYSENLLSDIKTVTSFSVSLARRNANEGWCRVEYSLDGKSWTEAGEEFQPMASGTAAEDYEFTLSSGDTDIFMIRVTYFFKEIPKDNAFLNFEGVEVMGY